MTAHPTTCLIDHEDGFRTVITLEEPSDSYVEQGAMGVLVVSGDRPGGELRIGLSPDALEAIERRCRELRGVPEGEVTEHVTVSQGGSPVIRDLTESVTRAEERAERLEELVQEWKSASGLVCGGDPDGVTPTAARLYWKEVERQRDALIEQVVSLTGATQKFQRWILPIDCPDCEGHGSQPPHSPEDGPCETCGGWTDEKRKRWHAIIAQGADCPRPVASWGAPAGVTNLYVGRVALGYVLTSQSGSESAVCGITGEHFRGYDARAWLEARVRAAGFEVREEVSDE